MSGSRSKLAAPHAGQLSACPVRSLVTRARTWAGLYVFGRGLRIASYSVRTLVRIIPAAVVLLACGPHAHIPPVPEQLVGALPITDSSAILARALSPVLYLQRDETFPLERVVAAVHPTRRIIAYYLLWRDDVHGAWVPFTVPTDEEVVWVGYDSTHAPTDVWTYWHDIVLHTKWPKRRVEIDVQWGKHGSLPRGVIESDLPAPRTLNFFYAATFFGEPDILLGDISRKGPIGFFHSYRRYRDFSRVVPTDARIDAVTRTEDPRSVLRAVFGSRYSNKLLWPYGVPSPLK